MKTNILVMAGLVAALASCQKDESITKDSSATSSDNASLNRTSTGTVSPTIPSSFTKKVLAEEFTGKNYGDTPESDNKLSFLSMTYSDHVYVASMHNNDMLETTTTDKLTNALTAGAGITYPQAMINRMDISGSRFINYTDYTSAISQSLASPADCGIAMSSSINGGRASVTVYTGFNSSLSGDYSMNVYMVEDNVIDRNGSLSQANSYNGVKASPFYKKGNPINGYVHNNVLRATLTPTMGTPINAAALTPGGLSTQTFMLDLPSNVNTANCYFIAFVTKVNSNVADEVLNVQKCRMGFSKNWN